jgi:NarL family two-component system response regulator LiaR
VGGHSGSDATIGVAIRVGVLGQWPKLRESEAEFVVGAALFVRYPDEPVLLRTIALRRLPSWLVLGQGLGEETLVSLANLVRVALPNVHLMILGTNDDLDLYDRWLARGARAYMRATIEPAEAVKVMLLADEADVSVVDESVPRLRAVRRAQLRLDLISKPFALTRREIEVLGLMRLGMRNSAIGSSLQLSESTVEFHVTNILSKLEAVSRTEAVGRANALGI